MSSTGGQNPAKEAEQETKEPETPAIMVAEASAEAPGEQPEETTACLQGAEAPEDKKKSGTLGRFRVPKKPNIKAPKVAGERVTLDRNAEKDFNVISRDPKCINQHCKIQFEDVIAEPDPTVFTFDCMWTVSYVVFTNSKLWCYRILSLLCSVPASLIWGLEFAVMSFCTIWCWQPRLRSFEIQMYYFRRLFEILLQVCMEPCCNSIGRVLSHIAITIRREG